VTRSTFRRAGLLRKLISIFLSLISSALTTNVHRVT
jgi:hypothetical protein